MKWKQRVVEHVMLSETRRRREKKRDLSDNQTTEHNIDNKLQQWPHLVDNHHEHLIL
jgi:uridine kinase